MSIVHLNRTPIIQGTATELPSSKSISNRAIVLDYLSGHHSTLNNLSQARDTLLMQNGIEQKELTIDVMDAGTTMRFLTAYFSVKKVHKIMTGTPRMKERPIRLLVDALREIGVPISYLENEGFPPLEINEWKDQLKTEIQIPANVSSQYVSALMMIAPELPKGLSIKLVGKLGSTPYVTMTAALMKKFGVEIDWDVSNGFIRVPSGKYEPTNLDIESDWSAASYWFAFTALAEKASVFLPRIKLESLQGDVAIVDIMNQLGVKTTIHKEGLLLSKKEHHPSIEWNFINCPDLAQTVIPVCAAKGIQGTFTGLESLRIKETDRIAALANELSKINADLQETQTGTWQLVPGQLTHQVIISTYHDHRMAMGFAPWATMVDITIEDPTVVNKSYPGFWKDVAGIGEKIITEQGM